MRSNPRPYFLFMNEFFECGRYRFPMLGQLFRPLVMGILNVTPDSFSDGGKFQNLDLALSHAEQMIADGVDIIDIGGESSRPGSQALSLEEELDRVMPVVYALRDCGKPISVDTYKPEVMKEVISAGADMINDIHGFTIDNAMDTVAASDVGLCIMHMQNRPQNMQLHPQYDNVIVEVTAFLRERIAVAKNAGIHQSRIMVDVGFGFGKKIEHNVELARNIGEIQKSLGIPMLAGLSMKSMIGTLIDKNLESRGAGSLAGAVACIANGAKIVRVHDVAGTVDAIKVWKALAN